MKPMDVPSNGLLKYNNEDGGHSFHDKLANVDQITWLTLSFYIQDDELIPNFSDYILLLPFIRHITEQGTVETLLNTFIDYVKQIYLLIGHFFISSNGIKKKLFGCTAGPNIAG
jgi:hypothetical protein